jgi:hypothetical protein
MAAPNDDPAGPAAPEATPANPLTLRRAPLAASAVGVAAAIVAGAGASAGSGALALGVAGALALPFAGVAIVVGAPALSIFGAILKANTHHHALAAVTFSLVGLGVALGAVALGARVAVEIGRARARGAGWVRGATGAIGLLAALVVLMLLRRAGGLDAAMLCAALVGGAAVPASRLPRVLSIAGPALALGVAAAGLGLAMTHPEVARGMAARGQIAGAAAGLFGPG